MRDMHSTSNSSDLGKRLAEAQVAMQQLQASAEARAKEVEEAKVCSAV